MGKKSDPPKVNKQAYNDLLAASTAAAQQAAQTQAEQLAWARETYAQDRALAEPIIQAAVDRMARFDEWAIADRERQAQFQVAEDRLLSDAMSWDSPERIAQAQAGAMSDVYGAMEGSREASQRALEGYGVDPSSTRFGALDIAQRANAAAAAVAAGNRAASATQKQAIDLRNMAIGVGRSYGQGAVGEAGAAGGQGAGAIGTSLGVTGSGAQTMGTGLQWGAMGQGALSGAAGILAQQQQALMDRYNAKTAASSVLPNALGTMAGTALGAYLGNPAAFGAATGGVIPEAASPSGGEQFDDVPAMVTAGEFVIPEDVVKWKGEDFFQRLIVASRKGMNNKGAVPTMREPAYG